MTKIDRLARSTSDLYRIVSTVADKGVAFKVVDDPTIDTTSRTGKLIMGILSLIAEFENDIRRQRQMDGIHKARERNSVWAQASSCLGDYPEGKKIAGCGSNSTGNYSADLPIEGVGLPRPVRISTTSD